jgi:hypothetical protein
MSEEHVDHPFQIDEIPDRIEHRRKIALRLALDHPEYAADDPTRSADGPRNGYRLLGPEVTGSGRGPHD